MVRNIADTWVRNTSIDTWVRNTTRDTWVRNTTLDTWVKNTTLDTWVKNTADTWVRICTSGLTLEGTLGQVVLLWSLG